MQFLAQNQEIGATLLKLKEIHRTNEKRAKLHAKWEREHMDTWHALGTRTVPRRRAVPLWPASLRMSRLAGTTL